MSEIALIKALAEDRNKITYRPSFAKITGSVLASILLQQTLYWFESNGGQFYKFMQPCAHSKYKKGDSWTEELAFTRYELAAALKPIATKSTAGANKKELMSVNEPQFNKDGLMLNASSLIIYWTDSSRLTWFWLNVDLLGKAVSQHYLGKSVNQNYLDNATEQNYLVKPDSSITFSSETTAETTTENKNAVAIATGTQDKSDSTPASIDILVEANKIIEAVQGKKVRNPDPVFDAVAFHIFGIDPSTVTKDAGGRIGPITQWLNCKSDGLKRAGGKVGFISRAAEPEHVKQFASWYKSEYPDANLPYDLVKFVESWRKWATSIAKQSASKAKVAAPVVAIPEQTPEQKAALELARKQFRPEWERQTS